MKVNTDGELCLSRLEPVEDELCWLVLNGLFMTRDNDNRQAVLEDRNLAFGLEEGQDEVCIPLDRADEVRERMVAATAEAPNFSYDPDKEFPFDKVVTVLETHTPTSTLS